ncbi:hypothetical protein HOLleu_15797 [Holothuria leucospilota]|uniref:Uncharacterized protein n=1 Tax=Holothuria leucospilota TaxID=206669 RepID=A0A9Q1HAF1_HOLLE|nr:hypothetical protein HOLleu_15797 [Holothuria leucospilota]
MKWKSSEQDEGNWYQEQAGEKRVKAEECGLGTYMPLQVRLNSDHVLSPYVREIDYLLSLAPRKENAEALRKPVWIRRRPVEHFHIFLAGE